MVGVRLSPPLSVIALVVFYTTNKLILSRPLLEPQHHFYNSIPYQSSKLKEDSIFNDSFGLNGKSGAGFSP
jgi:hypothetical protein